MTAKKAIAKAPKDDSAAVFLADGKAKIDALFADTLDHVSASIGDIKALGAMLLEHFTGAKPVVAEEEAPEELPEDGKPAEPAT